MPRPKTRDVLLPKIEELERNLYELRQLIDKPIVRYSDKPIGRPKGTKVIVNQDKVAVIVEVLGKFLRHGGDWETVAARDIKHILHHRYGITASNTYLARAMEVKFSIVSKTMINPNHSDSPVCVCYPTIGLIMPPAEDEAMTAAFDSLVTSGLWSFS